MHLIAIAFLFAAPTSPQIAPLTNTVADTLPQGTLGLSFGFPLGGPAPTSAPSGATAVDVGLSYFIQQQLALRVDFGLNATLSPDRFSGSAFDIQLGLRMYRTHADRLWMFIQPTIGFGRAPATGGAPGSAEYLDLGAGIGAEYFFTDRFSVGGILGVTFAVTNLGVSNLPPGAPSVVSTNISTGTSGLFASFYF